MYTEVFQSAAFELMAQEDPRCGYDVPYAFCARR